MVLARCVYTSEDPQVLIFDDLTQQNYGMVYDSLDVERIQLIVDKIAKYHALSKVLAEKVKMKIQFMILGKWYLNPFSN